MSDTDTETPHDIAGQVRLDDDDHFHLPPEYQDGSIVIRTPWCTEVHQGRCMTYYSTENDVPEGYVRLKRFGQDPELFEVEGYEA